MSVTVAKMRSPCGRGDGIIRLLALDRKTFGVMTSVVTSALSRVRCNAWRDADRPSPSSATAPVMKVEKPKDDTGAIRDVKAGEDPCEIGAHRGK